MAQVDVYYSTQSIYCYCLTDRLLWLQDQGVEVIIRPVLGAVLRFPENYAGRSALETAYFEADSQRVTEQLGLPFAGPYPSPITFLPGPGWRAGPDLMRNTRLNHLFVAAVQVGQGLGFLDHVLRPIWAGDLRGWDQPGAMDVALASAGLSEAHLHAALSLDHASAILNTNAQAMLEAGHWGVPLMVYRDEPFYGQDRFDTLIWRMKQQGDLTC